MAGAATVVAIGAPADRLALAARMGADAALDLGRTTRDGRAEVIRHATGGHGADIVVEAAGSAAAVEEGLDLVRNGGVYVIAGHYTDQGLSHINAHTQINRKHLEVRGCWGSEVRHLVRALTFLERSAGRLPWRQIGPERYGLAELNEALADAETMRVPKAVVDPQRMTVARWAAGEGR
jgi:L-iditol 2-dehydrogenase